MAGLCAVLVVGGAVSGSGSELVGVHARSQGAVSPVSAAAVWPVQGRVTRAFNPPAHPWLAGHRGVDIAAEAGSRVIAARGGTVSFAGVVANTPVVVVLLESGVRITYEPVSARVSAGDVVSTAQLLGTLEPSTHCTTPCLHLGAKRDQMYLEPLTTLGLRPVLLPWDE
ncbi:MAG: M23 family metallopeptidase [Actinobacteria bacterium]|nr:M23 family metallopeptidase [Actinomycetota bacterium]